MAAPRFFWPRERPRGGSYIRDTSLTPAPQFRSPCSQTSLWYDTPRDGAWIHDQDTVSLYDGMDHRRRSFAVAPSSALAAAANFRHE